ncbi:MAG: hypothetical protein AAFW81_03600 [Pseudomonadota bacterium]
MNILRWSLALGLGGLLVFFGVMKFTGGAHIFPYIEYKAAAANAPFAALAYPLGNYATGALELAAGVLLIVPATRKLGAMVAVLPFLGAVLFHLSPFLGVTTPDGYADPKPVEALAAGGPFSRGDFSEGASMALFTIAVAGLIAAIVNYFIQRSAD